LEKSDKQAKMNVIMDTAERLFSEIGFDGVPTRRIASEAGVNIAMLSYYFGSKKGLYIAMFKRKLSSMQGVLQQINNDDSRNSWEKLNSFVEIYCDRMVYDDGFQKLLYYELSLSMKTTLSAQIRKILMQNVRQFSLLIQKGVDKGEFDANADKEMIIAAFYGTKNFIFNNALMASDIFGYNIKSKKQVETVLKPRLKNFFQHFLFALLVIDDSAV
jgi:AcrR family transcriptional regulator